jgi:hypothetical protein
MSFLKGFTSLFDWMFPQSYQEMSDDLDEKMQDLYTKMRWGDYKNPMPNSPRNFINPSWNTSADYTRSISSEEWNNMIKHNKTVEEVYGDVKAVTSSQFLDEILRLVPSGEFQPYAYYNEDMDSIQVYFKDVGSYTQTLNNNVELHLSHGSNEITGATILNIKRLLNKDDFK